MSAKSALMTWMVVLVLAILGLGAPAGADSYSRGGQAPYCEAEMIYGPNPRGASANMFQGGQMIVWDRAVMATLPYVEKFVLAHECAHHALGHTSPQGFLQEGHDFPRKELDADCWAARMLVMRGEQAALDEQLAIFETLGDTRAGPRYATFAERIARMKTCADDTPG